MYIKYKIFIRSVCPTIALLFFFSALNPAMVQAQADEKSEIANSLYMLKLAIAVKNAHQTLTEEERLAVKEEILILMDTVFKQIKLSSISEETIKKYDSILPQHFKGKLQLVSDIAKADITTEEKVNALAAAFDIGCDSITYGAALIFMLSILLGIDFGYFGFLMYLAAVLCYLGVF
jgi:hypothetical protein